MGKQLGIINVRGKVGDMGYVKTEDGYFVRRNTSVTKDRINNDPAFKNTRRVMAEFSNAGKAGKLIRDAIKIQLKMAGDSKQSSRLVKLLMKMAKTDTTNIKGERRPERGEFAFLEGFEFNRGNELQQSFLVQYTSEIDRTAGTCTVDVPQFIPSDVLMIPEDATHFRLVSAGCELDFENNKYVLGISNSNFFSVGNTPVNALSLVNTITPASTLPIMLVLGIRFYQLVNNDYYQLDGAKYNAVRILKTNVL